jgi:hypothetical protein
MCKKLIAIGILIFLNYRLMGQFNTANPSDPSINLAPASKNIQITNDLFNGKINTNIPIFDYTDQGIPISISLNYSDGNGVKADEMPSWVGLGWGLQAGGFVHRTVRGKPDETLDFETDFYQVKSISSNVDYWQTTTSLNATDYSYFGNYTKLNNVNWSTSGYISSLLPTGSNYAFPVAYNDGNVSGNVTYMNTHPAYDLAPDEFTFSAGGISGKFYLNHLNKWVVSASDGKKYDVQVSTGPETLYTGHSVPRIIKYLILTSEDGLKYVFGNENATTFADRLYEYSRSSYMNPAIPNPEVSIYWFYGPLMDMVPHTWHLSKIENLKTGSAVTFSYTKSGFQFFKSRQAFGSDGAYVYNNIQGYYTNSWSSSSYRNASAITKIASEFFVLNSINFSTGMSLKFESTNSSQMSTDQDANSTDGSGFRNHGDLFWAANNKLYKLDRVKLMDGTNLIEQFDFSYTGNDVSHRLKLSSVQKTNPLETGVVNKYSFEYNSSQLPVYAAGESDHWGYYNHKNFFTSVAAPYNATNLANFSSYRDPDYNYVESEILNKVTYPTGGAVEFIYEPNSYSKQRNRDTYVISGLSSDLIGGGVRIKKVKYYDDPGHVAMEKEYDYSSLANPALSSGVMNSPAPTYLIGTVLKSTGFTSNCYSGNPVTYSLVKEKTTGKGSTTFEFSNYDNGENDELPVTLVTTPYITGFETLYKNNSYKRGKIVNIKYKDEAGNLLKEISNIYEHNGDESSKDEIRSIYNKEQGSNSYFYGAVTEKVYHDQLVSSTENNYEQGITYSAVTLDTYDSKGNLAIRQVTDSKGGVIKKDINMRMILVRRELTLFHKELTSLWKNTVQII